MKTTHNNHPIRLTAIALMPLLLSACGEVTVSSIDDDITADIATDIATDISIPGGRTDAYVIADEVYPELEITHSTIR